MVMGGLLSDPKWAGDFFDEDYGGSFDIELSWRYICKVPAAAKRHHIGTVIRLQYVNSILD